MNFKHFIFYAIPLALLMGCSDGGNDDGDTDTPSNPGDDNVEQPVKPAFNENVVMELDTVGGFQAHFKYTTLMPTETDESFRCGRPRLYISTLPFTPQEVLDGSFAVKEAYFDRITFRTIYGLAPNQRYYVRYCCPLANGEGEDSTYVFSKQLAFDTANESWFERVESSISSIKDVTVSVYLNWASEPMIKGETLHGGYDIEHLGSQLRATYRKISPEFETYPDQDTKPDAVEYTPNGARIELHNLQPGEKVRIKPWVMIGDKKEYAEDVVVSSCNLETSGYIRIGACMWSTCDLGADNPWTVGTKYADVDGLASDSLHIPGEGAWENLMIKDWVCGTLEGVKGWFVIDGYNALFLPFSYNNGYDNSATYWGDELVHPSGSGAGYYARRIFMATDAEGLKSHTFYGKDYYEPINDDRFKYPVRLVKYL